MIGLGVARSPGNPPPTILNLLPLSEVPLAVSPNLLVVLDGTAYRIVDTGQQLLAEPATGPGTRATQSLEPTATPGQAASVTATPPTDLPAVAVQPPQAEQPAASAQVPFCTAPALGVGLLLVPGYWAWRRQQR